MSLSHDLDRAVGSVADPVGTVLEDLRTAWAASCVLEDSAGRVISHALVGAAPECVVTAVLSRSAQPLHAARGAARRSAVTSGGPVVTTSLEGWSDQVTVLPLGRLGWLWVLHAEELQLESLAAAGQLLSHAVERSGARATDEGLLDALEGHGALVATRADTSVIAVRCLDGAVNATDLHGALRRGLPSGAQLTVTPQVAYVVLRGDVTLVEKALASAGSQLGISLAGAAASAAQGLETARGLADRALDARQVLGRVLTVDECRPYELLTCLLRVVDRSPVLGADPLVDLLAADAALAETLKAWLDHFGDIPAAALALGVHPNTFRYRLNRAKELTRADLCDPVARLEVHLRLLRS